MCLKKGRLGFPGCYRHEICRRERERHVKPMVIPSNQAPLKISMEHEALERGFLFWKWYGSCFHVFFFEVLGAIPPYHTCLIVEFYPVLCANWTLKISQRSFNKNRLPLKTAGHLSRTF